tara:strand:+ start:1358 stop:2203 length:846 start_codon:yes stop_codon:yes gene_type:complete
MSKNKILIVKIFFSLIFFYNCSNQQIIPSNIEKVVNKYYEGFLKNDSAMMVSLLDKNYKSVGYPTKGDKRDGLEEIGFINMINGWHSDFSIEEKTISTYKANDNFEVYVRGVEKFKHNETGAIVDVRFLDIWTVSQSGKILSRERFQDMLDYWSDIDFGIAKEKEVTFSVDMSGTVVENGGGDDPAVYIVSGGSTGPSGVKMIKGENNIWSAKVMLTPGEHFYKFRNGLYVDWGIDGWEDGSVLKENDCGPNDWGDRRVMVSLSGEQAVGPFCFSSCDPCD